MTVIQMFKRRIKLLKVAKRGPVKFECQTFVMNGIEHIFVPVSKTFSNKKMPDKSDEQD